MPTVIFRGVIMSSWVDVKRIGQKFGLKLECRRDCVQGHSWWDLSLPANGMRHDHAEFETWLAERIEDIQASNKWRVVGFTMSDMGEKIGLLAKDVRMSHIILEIEGYKPLGVSYEDIERCLANLGIKDLIVRQPL